MSKLTIAPYFPFRRIKILKQHVRAKAHAAVIHLEPNKRFMPVCHECGKPGAGVHSWAQRKVRDLNMAAAKVWITCQYRKLFCSHCQRIHTEDLQLFHPYLRVTCRMARYVYQLCQYMSVSEVARHLSLNWKTVKSIDKYFLEHDFGHPNLNGLKILAVDEISIRKGHKYLTIVLDYLSGRVVYVGKDRKSETLERFFNQLNDKQLNGIEAVVMDMWDPFIKAVKKKYLRPRSYSICSTWSPILTASSTRLETANIAKPMKRIKPYIKAANICY